MNTTADPALSSITQGLVEKGWACLPDFLPADEARALRAEAGLAWDGGEFRQAGVGRGANRVIREDIRRDHVRWLEPGATSPAEARYLARLEELRGAINRESYLGLFSFEGHHAVYPPGGFYRPHLDRHRGTMDRVITVILYLNEDWREGDGGELRLWTTPGACEGPSVTIEPRLGTLVVFLAGDHWHEVLPARRERRSITGWFRTREA